MLEARFKAEAESPNKTLKPKMNLNSGSLSGKTIDLQCT